MAWRTHGRRHGRTSRDDFWRFLCLKKVTNRFRTYEKGKNYGKISWKVGLRWYVSYIPIQKLTGSGGTVGRTDVRTDAQTNQSYRNAVLKPLESQHLLKNKSRKTAGKNRLQHKLIWYTQLLNSNMIMFTNNTNRESFLDAITSRNKIIFNDWLIKGAGRPKSVSLSNCKNW